jgi:periplasmic protein TonB
MTRSVVVALTTSAFILALATPGFSQTKTEAPPIPRAGVNGVTVPSCVYCPVPDYSEEGRNAKVQGTVVVQVVVTVDGRAERASVVRGLGSGLDEKAIEAVKKWRFKPAHDSDGHPVAVRVPMEVTFRIN